MKTKQKPHYKQWAVRMDDDLKARILKYQQKMKRTGLEVNFSSAVRSLIKKGLEAAQS